MITHYTDKQLEIEKIINKFGLLTELEKSFGKYCADIWIPELDWIVEIDGPQHYQKENNKRDKELFRFGIKLITHLNSDISKREAKRILGDVMDKIVEERHEERLEKRN